MTCEHGFHYLFQQLNNNAIVLTPNRRLSATLHTLYQHYKATESTYWETPDILPVNTWMQSLWLDYTSKIFIEAPFLLNATQEQFLWETIITKANENLQLLQIPETADISKSAFQLLRQWSVDIQHPIFKSADTYKAFYEWALAFEMECQENHWIDNASLTDCILKLLSTEKILPEKKIFLVGFTELSPQLKQIFAYYKTETENIRTSFPASNFRIALKDTEQELLIIARWAKTILTSYPKARIGCVIPSLDKRRDRVVQVFSEMIDETFFNISAGKPLSQCPVINIALQVLSLHRTVMPLTHFTNVLMSPFVGHAESERISRANFDGHLRRENRTRIRLPLDIASNHCPLLLEKLQAFYNRLATISKKHSYSEWAQLFNELLITVGWPGERSLTSEEYQMVEQWLMLLQEFATLDQVTQPTTMAHALVTLQKMAANTIFQPKTPDAPIQILGVLEAAGLPFDYLWVTGMDDMSWPPQPKPNPLIPKSLQRELQTPHATAERELIYCQQLVRQFEQNAAQLIFSHAETNNELELQPSSLIKDLPEITINNLQLDDYQTFSEKIFQSKDIAFFNDEIAQGYYQSDKVRGGMSIIKQQALCPFKAFSEWRLHARELEITKPGMRAKDRGSLLHKVLEILWNTLQDHATLCHHSADKLDLIIRHCIKKALSLFPHFYINKKQYRHLETERLYQLIWDWLHLEKQRPPFKVLHSEKTIAMTLNHLNLTLRIDRIDELEDGSKLIIDYKTSIHNDPGDWFSERPEEPQLPLYALFDSDIVGIAYAQIAPGKNCFKGVSRHPLNVKGIIEINEFKKASMSSWPEQVSHWKTILTQLSDDFYNGKAQIDPKAPPETCVWCALKSFCRVKETLY